MKPYKPLLKENDSSLYTVDKYFTTVHRKLKVGDSIPIYNYERRKVYNYKVLSVNYPSLKGGA